MRTDIKNPLAVYFLIQAEYGYSQFANQQVGKVVLSFEDGSSYDYPLVMSINIRDWMRGTVSYAVTTVTSSDVLYSWDGTAPNGNAGGIDLLQILIPEEYKNSTLKSIQIVDTSLEDTGDVNPGVKILAASVEIPDDTPGPWLYQIEQIPVSDSSIEWDLSSGDLLILTGGRLQHQGFDCGGNNAAQICVLVIEATKAQRITIESLIQKNNWLAVTRQSTKDEAIESIQNEFWLSPNCGSGCSIATIGIFTDENQVDTIEINRP